MGHVVFAAPTIERLHFHGPLARVLFQRGHDLTVLSADAVSYRCFSTQGLPTRELRPGRPSDRPRMPIEEFALRECRRLGHPRPGQARFHRTVRRLASAVAPLMRFFETELPQVVIIHAQRGGLHRLIHFVAIEFGARVLYTGDGLLPGTVQFDEEGLDGESSVCRRDAAFYRGGEVDDVLLAASLTASLAGSSRRPGHSRAMLAPDLTDRVAGLASGIVRLRAREALERLSAWRRACRDARVAPDPGSLDLPEQPFVAVLVQARDDPRMRLDADAPPSPSKLIFAAHAAVRSADARIPIAIVPPPGRRELDRADLALLASRAPGIVTCHPRAAAVAACTAAAVISVNHPLGLTGIIAGTPVLHLGRTPYAVGGVSTKASPDRLRDALRAATERDAGDLAQRFATHLLTHDHIWCDPRVPDENGVHGLVIEIEKRIQLARPTRESLSYVAGPDW